MTLLGRLAVDKRYQGQGIGQLLIASAIRLVMSGPSASRGLIVDMKEESLIRFYGKYGFIQLPDEPAKAVLIFDSKDYSAHDQES